MRGPEIHSFCMQSYSKARGEVGREGGSRWEGGRVEGGKVTTCTGKCKTIAEESLKPFGATLHFHMHNWQIWNHRFNVFCSGF